jgi:hypothetical protein
MPRLARLDAPRTLHHVIVRGNEMRRIVDDRRDREAWVSRMWEEMGLLSLIALMRPPMIGVMGPLGSGQFGVSDWPQF